MSAMIQIDYFAQAAAFVPQGRWDQVEKLSDAGLAINSKNPGLLMLKALCFMQVGNRFRESETYFRRAINLMPDNPEFHNNYGVLLRRSERAREAFVEFQRAVELNPRYLEALRNLALLAWTIGENEVARVALSTYTGLNPGDRMVTFHLAELSLGLGALKDGWRLYQYRPNRPELAQRFSTTERFFQMAPLPKRLDGKLITLLPEQGFGDVLFFLRYAAPLKRRGARIGYGAEQKIWRFVQDCDAVDEVFNEKSILPHLQSAYTFFAGDLPFLSAEDDSTPQSIRIPALPEKIAQARQQLAELGPPPYIGVNWRAGNRAAPDDFLLFKSIAPRLLGEALRDMNATVVSLQRLPQPGEYEEFNEGLGRPVPNLSWVQDDFETLMGYLAAIDEIVGVSSTSVHLRAAMGLDAKVIFISPVEWRWMLEGDVSPWFPSCKVYRAQLPELRSGAMEQLQRDLADSLKARAQT
ncbi:MAG: tetratricopeptide repeat protein [bacterium]|jgi:tetratricopeptide (TPR) repeat protein